MTYIPNGFFLQVKDFFVQAKNSMELNGGRLDHGRIKAILEQKMIARETELTEARVKGKFLPLSEWVSQGFDGKAIEEKAEKQASDLCLGFQLSICFLDFSAFWKHRWWITRSILLWCFSIHVRFEWVYRVPVLSINSAHIKEKVSETIMSATRKVKPGKRSLEYVLVSYSFEKRRWLPCPEKSVITFLGLRFSPITSKNNRIHTGKQKDKDNYTDEEQSEDNLDEKEWCSVDSSDGEKQQKIIHVHENKGTKGGKKAKQLKMSEEEKKALKENNQAVMKIVKKALKELEPLSKSASKTMTSANSDEQFKKEVWALKQVVKEAKKVERQHKDNKQTSLSFDHNEETIAALKEQIQKKQKAIENVDAMLQGGFDAAHLELLASAAKRRKDAQDVEWKAEWWAMDV